MYRVNDYFLTVQGEGIRKGVPSIFIRFAGCNLRATCWKQGGCDTDFDEYSVYDDQGLLNLIARTNNIRDVVLTGGEPTLQNLTPIVKRLSEAGKFITLETNGTIFPASAINYIDLYSCSPKYANFNTEFDPGTIKHIIRAIEGGKHTQVKFIITEQADVDFAKEIIKKIVNKIGYPYEYDNGFAFYLHPHEPESYYETRTTQRFREVILDNLHDSLLNRVGAMFQLQDHKILNLK